MMTMEYNHDLELQATKEEGVEEGMELGLDKGINALIETCRELDVQDSIIISKVMKKFNLTREEALAYM